MAQEIDEFDASNYKTFQDKIVEDAGIGAKKIVEAMGGLRHPVGTHECVILPNGESCYFKFQIPGDFVALTELSIIVIPDATEAIIWTAVSEYGAAGEVYNTHTESAVNINQAVTLNQFAVLDLDANGLGAAFVANDFVGIRLTSGITMLRVHQLILRYT